MYKIFLSPSNQFENKYAKMNTNEGEQMGKVAVALRKALLRCGFGVMLMHDYSMAKKVVEANKYSADLYIPIHSNAYNGKVSGTRLFCWSKKETGYYACCDIAKYLFPLTPGTSENITEATDLYEVRMPKAPTAYIEVDFHDVPDIAKWIITHIDDIAEAICRGICDYFDVPYVAPEVKPTKLYRVQVGAFSKKENAQKMLAEVQKYYPDAFITEVK